MPERMVSEVGEAEVADRLPRRLELERGPTRRPSVSVVIPAKNEARNLSHVMATIPPWVDEIILVDGHSVDDTAAVARKLNPDVKIVAQQGHGKGDALQAGFAACTGEIIIMMDADGSTDGAEIPCFVQALLEGADFAKGSRFTKGGGSDDITTTRRYGNWVLITLVNRLFGTRYTDLCYGYNGFWSRHLPVLDLDCPGFEIESVMNIRAAKAGLWVREVSSHEHARMHGESNLHVIRDGWRIAKVIARERLLRRGHAKLPPTRTPVSEIVATSQGTRHVAEEQLEHG